MVVLFGNSIILLGAVFMLISVVGLWRFNDLFMKMHSATKAGALGSGLILAGVGVQIKDIHTFTEIVLLVIFIAITNPISAQLIGRLYYLRQNRGLESIGLNGDD